MSTGHHVVEDSQVEHGTAEWNEHTAILEELLKNEQFVAAVKGYTKENAEYDIPFLGGSNNDGNTVYYDRRFFQAVKAGQLKYRGQAFDPLPFIHLHEALEGAAIRGLGTAYDTERKGLPGGHCIATWGERRAVEHAGMDWVTYQKAIEPWIRTDEKESTKDRNLPPDLVEVPYKGTKFDRDVQRTDAGHPGGMVGGEAPYGSEGEGASGAYPSDSSPVGGYATNAGQSSESGDPWIAEENFQAKPESRSPDWKANYDAAIKEFGDYYNHQLERGRPLGRTLAKPGGYVPIDNDSFGGYALDKKLPHSKVQYGPGHVKGDHCAVCTHYIPNGPHCSLVKDPIEPTGWCDRFEDVINHAKGYAKMANLTADKRKKMPSSQFAMSGKRFPMNDVEHARLAIGGATRSMHAGNISASTAAAIKAKARAKLGMGGYAPGSTGPDAPGGPAGGYAPYRMGNPTTYSPHPMQDVHVSQMRRPPGGYVSAGGNNSPHNPSTYSPRQMYDGTTDQVHLGSDSRSPAHMPIYRTPRAPGGYAPKKPKGQGHYMSTAAHIAQSAGQSYGGGVNSGGTNSGGAGGGAGGYMPKAGTSSKTMAKDAKQSAHPRMHALSLASATHLRNQGHISDGHHAAIEKNVGMALDQLRQQKTMAPDNQPSPFGSFAGPGMPMPPKTAGYY